MNLLLNESDPKISAQIINIFLGPLTPKILRPWEYTFKSRSFIS